MVASMLGESRVRGSLVFARVFRGLPAAARSLKGAASALLVSLTLDAGCLLPDVSASLPAIDDGSGAPTEIVEQPQQAAVPPDVQSPGSAGPELPEPEQPADPQPPRDAGQDTRADAADTLSVCSQPGQLVCPEAASCVDPMLDASHCGSCGHSCGVGACLAGRCTAATIATGTVWIDSIAVADGEVYFQDLGEITSNSAARPGRLVKVSRDGGSSSVLASAGPQPRGFTLDETNVYWTLADRGVLKIPRAGGTASVISQSDAGAAVVAISGQLYYASESALLKQSITGGQPKVVVTTEIFGALTHNASTVFWSTREAVNALDIQTGESRKLAAVAGYVYAMVANEDHLLWSTDAGIWQLTLRSAGEASQIVTGISSGLALDRTHIYFRQGSKIQRAALAGGTAELLAEDDMVGSNLAIDEDSIYWANKLVPPTLERLPK
jgi:hypothetical protein